MYVIDNGPHASFTEETPVIPDGVPPPHKVRHVHHGVEELRKLCLGYRNFQQGEGFCNLDFERVDFIIVLRVEGRSSVNQNLHQIYDAVIIIS